jgi:myosin-5
MKEGYVLVHMQHPNVLKVVGVYLPNGTGPEIATEYMGNGSLEKTLEAVKAKRAPGFWTHFNVCKMIVGTVLGMKYLHSKGVIHRDLKPANLLIGDDYGIRIGDFGHAKLRGSGDSTDTAGVGTRPYMSPEIFKNEAQTPKMDVYGFGLILYEILVGKQVFPADLAMFQRVNDVCSGKRPSVSDAHLAPAVKRVIVNCWDVDPDIRPSFDEILDTLEKARFPFYEDVKAEEVEAYVDDIRRREGV